MTLLGLVSSPSSVRVGDEKLSMSPHMNEERQAINEQRATGQTRSFSTLTALNSSESVIAPYFVAIIVYLARSLLVRMLNQQIKSNLASQYLLLQVYV